MNQSLDNDEVLNVRWATEDPNPRAKVYEYRRLVNIGQKGIGSKLTPEFVAAVRKMDELEGIVAPLPEEDDRDVRAMPSHKRAQLEGPGSGDAQIPGGAQVGQAKKARVEVPPAPASQPKGLLSGSALDSLKKAAALRKLKQQKASAAAPAGTAESSSKDPNASSS